MKGELTEKEDDAVSDVGFISRVGFESLDSALMFGFMSHVGERRVEKGCRRKKMSEDMNVFR